MTTQNEVNYTPGPWVWQKDGHLESSENGPVILGGSEENPHGILINQEDANLIAVAPDMLEMLYTVLPAVEESDEFNKPGKKLGTIVRNLIARAEGRI